MFERVALVHYHEIGLKGRNSSVFERRLRDNLDAALVGLPVKPAERIASRLAVEVTQSSALDEVVARLARDPRHRLRLPGVPNRRATSSRWRGGSLLGDRGGALRRAPSGCRRAGRTPTSRSTAWR